jgi:hypothetical protein
MTREQATALARDFVLKHPREVLSEPESVRQMQADRFNRLFGRAVYPCDFWVVEFRKVLPPGVAVEMPGTVAVEVIPSTGEVREIYAGMYVR